MSTFIQSTEAENLYYDLGTEYPSADLESYFTDYDQIESSDRIWELFERCNKPVYTFFPSPFDGMYYMFFALSETETIAQLEAVKRRIEAEVASE